MTDDSPNMPSRGDNPTEGGIPSPGTPAGPIRMDSEGLNATEEVAPELIREQRAVALHPGDVVADRFEVVRQLGFGGMGAVYLVKDRITNQDRALKVMLPSLLASEGAQQRFLNEVTISQQLTHDGVVRVFDVSEDHQRRFRFFTMEYVQGRTLHRLLKERGGRLPLKEAIHIARQLCRVLEYAHQRTIHRDLKPQNIMVRDNWHIKVLDFGLAKLMSPGQLTKSSLALGTAYYQSPEQSIHLSELDQRADIYSVGVILYQMLTGEIPVGRVKAPSSVVSGVPECLDDVVLRCIEPKPEDRFGDVAALRRALDEATAEGAPQGAKEGPRAGAALAAARRGLLSLRGRINRAWLVVAVVAVVAGAALLLRAMPSSRPSADNAAAELGTVPSERSETGLSPIQPIPEEEDAAAPPAVESPAPPIAAPPAKGEVGDTHTIDLGGVKMELAWIPPGSFMMGSPDTEEGRDDSEGPQHRVTLTKGFWMGKYEVTQAQWQAVMGDNPSDFKGDTLPVECVSWNDCQAFIEKLNARGGGGFRLPTEAEWEYACRAGSKAKCSFGDDEGRLGDYAWYSGNSGNNTHPVGEKKANAWGLHDMHGNVWEWCQDWYDEDYYANSPERDPQGPTSGSNRVGRGGSWDGSPGYCRSARRCRDAPGNRGHDLGFRVALPVVQ